MSAPAASAPPQDALARLGERLSERVNPIVVKEVRQGLRTRSFWVFFGLQLLLCLVIALVAWATSGDGWSQGTGYFVAFFLCLSVVQFFVLPYSAYRSMAREREDETWVLLTLTGIGPRRVLRGKLMSFSIQGLLYASAAGPFVLFSYYLNGVDLPTLLVALVLGFAWHVFLVALGVSIATLAESRLVRGALHFVLIFALLQGLLMGMSTALAMVEIARKALSDAAVWVGIGAVAFGMVTTAVLLFEAAAARLSLVTENYAWGPRLAFTVQALGGLALFALGWWAADFDSDVAVAGQVVACLYFASVGLFVATDRDGMARAHVRTDRSRLSLFKPGALRGYRLVLLGLAVCTTVFLLMLVESEGSPDAGDMAALLAAPLHAALLLSAALLLPRLLGQPQAQLAALSRVFAAALFALMAGGPALVALMLGLEPDDQTLNLLNPIVGVVNVSKERDPWGGLLVVAAAAGVAVLLAHAVLERRDAQATKGAV